MSSLYELFICVSLFVICFELVDDLNFFNESSGGFIKILSCSQYGKVYI